MKVKIYKRLQEILKENNKLEKTTTRVIKHGNKTMDLCIRLDLDGSPSVHIDANSYPGCQIDIPIGIADKVADNIKELIKLEVKQ